MVDSGRPAARIQVSHALISLPEIAMPASMVAPARRVPRSRHSLQLGDRTQVAAAAPSIKPAGSGFESLMAYSTTRRVIVRREIRRGPASVDVLDGHSAAGRDQRDLSGSPAALLAAPVVRRAIDADVLGQVLGLDVEAGREALH